MLLRVLTNYTANITIILLYFQAHLNYQEFMIICINCSVTMKSRIHYPIQPRSQLVFIVVRKKRKNEFSIVG